MILQNELLSQQRFQDLRWATRNSLIQERFSGELVVVHRQQVIAHGHDEAALLEQVASDEHPREELVVVEILSAEFDLPFDSP